MMLDGVGSAAFYRAGFEFKVDFFSVFASFWHCFVLVLYEKIAAFRHSKAKGLDCFCCRYYAHFNIVTSMFYVK